MPRVRLGVVIVVPEPVATEIQGLRRALGDPVLDRIMPHLTLVPPVNVRVDDLPSALAVLRRAAAGARPLALALGAPQTFGPDSPTLFLPVTGVGGDPGGLEALAPLRESAFVPPLHRVVDHAFVPHVTIATELGPGRLAAGIAALADFTASFVADTVTLLSLDRPPAPDAARWAPIADARLGAPAVVGRGGYELELTTGSVLDPEAQALLDGSDRPGAPPDGDPVSGPDDDEAPPGARPVVVTARHRGEVVGVGWGHAWAGADGGTGAVAAVVATPGAARDGVERQIELALESHIAST